MIKATFKIASLLIGVAVLQSKSYVDKSFTKLSEE
jgi:hypothetical protein